MGAIIGDCQFGEHDIRRCPTCWVPWEDHPGAFTPPTGRDCPRSSAGPPGGWEVWRRENRHIYAIEPRGIVGGLVLGSLMWAAVAATILWGLPRWLG